MRSLAGTLSRCSFEGAFSVRSFEGAFSMRCFAGAFPVALSKGLFPCAVLRKHFYAHFQRVDVIYLKRNTSRLFSPFIIKKRLHNNVLSKSFSTIKVYSMSGEINTSLFSWAGEHRKRRGIWVAKGQLRDNN